MSEILHNNESNESVDLTEKSAEILASLDQLIPALESALNSTGLIRKGADNPKDVVIQLQQLASLVTNKPLVADGAFGPKTKTAIKALQRKLNISPDGVVGIEGTLAALKNLQERLSENSKNREEEIKLASEIDPEGKFGKPDSYSDLPEKGPVLANRPESLAQKQYGFEDLPEEGPMVTNRPVNQPDTNSIPINSVNETKENAVWPKRFNGPIEATVKKAGSFGLDIATLSALRNKLEGLAKRPNYNHISVREFDKHCTNARVKFMEKKGIVPIKKHTDEVGNNINIPQTPRRISTGTIRALAKKYFPAKNVEQAVRVCKGESSFDAHAFNPNGSGRRCDIGCMQINVYWQRDNLASMGISDVNELWDPETNMKVAGALFKKNGYRWKGPHVTWYAADKVGVA